MIHTSNPETRDAPNPYASSQSAPETTSGPSSLNIPASIAIACCVVSLGLWLLALIVSLPYGSPNAPPLIAILGFAGMFMVLPGLGLAGAVSMLQRKRYGLCLAAACGMMVPLLGPCFGLTLPVGIWAVILLRRHLIRESFVRSLERCQNEFNNADDALAAASKLDRNGDWDAAIALYRFAADRWPEHATYADNCIKEISKNQLQRTQTDGEQSDARERRSPADL
jgi:hypothetical protein